MPATLPENLVAAIRFYLEIKATQAAYDLRKQIERDIEQSETEIAVLRSLGDDASQRRADRLRERIIRSEGAAATVALSAKDFESKSGATNPDGKRAVHTD